MAWDNGCHVAALVGVQRIGRGHQGKDMEAEFGAERTACAESLFQSQRAWHVKVEDGWRGRAGASWEGGGGGGREGG